MIRSKVKILFLHRLSSFWESTASKVWCEFMSFWCENGVGIISNVFINELQNGQIQMEFGSIRLIVWRKDCVCFMYFVQLFRENKRGISRIIIKPQRMQYVATANTHFQLTNGLAAFDV